MAIITQTAVKHASSMFLGMHPTGQNAKQIVAAENAREKAKPIPSVFFPYDSRIDLCNAGDGQGRPPQFFGEKKEDKKPLAIEHEFIPGVI